MLVLCLIGLAVLLSFNTATIWLGLASGPHCRCLSAGALLLLAAGGTRLAFNWGALLGYTAVLGRLEWAAAVLYAGAIAWTIGYDTIYAHQDREDDALLGLKSTALKFGRATTFAVFYALPGSGSLPVCSPAPRSSSSLAWPPPVPISSGKWPRSISTTRRIA